MAIDNPQLLKFVDETVRPLADLLAGILETPTAYADALVGQGHAATLGTDDATLLRAEAWVDADYAALGAPQVVTGSDSGARTLLTNYDVVGLSRVVVVLKNLIAANPSLGPLVRKMAVNPRPR